MICRIPLSCARVFSPALFFVVLISGMVCRYSGTLHSPLSTLHSPLSSLHASHTALQIALSPPFVPAYPSISADTVVQSACLYTSGSSTRLPSVFLSTSLSDLSILLSYCFLSHSHLVRIPYVPVPCSCLRKSKAVWSFWILRSRFLLLPSQAYLCLYRPISLSKSGAKIISK